MAMGSLDRGSVNLIPGQLRMHESKDMPILRMTRWELKKHRFDVGKNGLRLAIVMKRKIMSEMMTTYLPSALLIAITFATTFFKPFFFEAALSVNLTTMLVMTTIFISKMEGLPSTSDIKMIDIWLVLCQMVPFAEVVLLTAMEYHRKDETEKKVKKKNKSSNSLSIHIVSANVNQDHGKEDDLEQRREPPLQMSWEDNDEEDSEKKCFRSCWKPDLKTMGRCNLSLLVVIQFRQWLNLFYPFRKESATVSGVGKLHRLLCHCL